jgi:DNA-binding Lrp family transcriptional regulator
MTLDDLDTKILQYLSVGTSSYEELAHTCNVTRNTIYRRIAALENKGIIRNTLNCIVNLEQMDITPVTIGAKIPQIIQDKTINLLVANHAVRFLWRTYGDHNLTLVAFCRKGKEGEVIQEIRGVLEESNADHICISVGFIWEKMSYSPFDEQYKIEKEIAQIIDKRY